MTRNGGRAFARWQGLASPPLEGPANSGGGCELSSTIGSLVLLHNDDASNLKQVVIHQGLAVCLIHRQADFINALIICSLP